MSATATVTGLITDVQRLRSHTGARWARITLAQGADDLVLNIAPGEYKLCSDVVTTDVRVHTTYEVGPVSGQPRVLALRLC